MQNSESNKSLQALRDNSASSAAKSAMNTSRPIINKKVDSVKRRSRTITSKNGTTNNGGSLNLTKQNSNDNQKTKNVNFQDKENIQPNFQREVSLKELNALSALKRLSDFNDFDDSYNKLDETFRGIHGWNTKEEASVVPFTQRVLKEKDSITNKRGNLMKKDKVPNFAIPMGNNNNNNNYPYKNILQNMSNNINTYEKRATELLNMKESFFENDKENGFEKERFLLYNNGQQGGGFGNIVQDLKKLQVDLQSPEKSRCDIEHQEVNGGFVKPLNSNLQKQHIEKKGILLKQRIEIAPSNLQNRQNGGSVGHSQTPQGQQNADFKNIQQLLKATSNEKSLKMKFNEDYSINISSSNPHSILHSHSNNITSNGNQHITSSVAEKSHEERATVCSQHTHNTNLNTSSSTQEIEGIHSQLNQPYLRSRIESYSHVVDEISKRKKNHVVRVADTERYDKSFVQYPLQLKNNTTNNTLGDVANTSMTEIPPSQNVISFSDLCLNKTKNYQLNMNLSILSLNSLNYNDYLNFYCDKQQSNHTEKIQSPNLNSYLVKKKNENNHPESENKRSKSINGTCSTNQTHFLSYQNTISNQNNGNLTINNSSSQNSTCKQTMYGSNLGSNSVSMYGQQQIQYISKSISLGKNTISNSNNTSIAEKENLNINHSRTNATNTPNSSSILSSNKSKEFDPTIRVFPHLSDIQHEKKGLHQRLNVVDNDLNPYNVAGHNNNIFYQPSHIPLTPHQFSQSLSRNSYNPKFTAQNNSDKSKNDYSWQKSVSQNSQTHLTQNSVSIDRKQLPSSTTSGNSTLVIYTNQNMGSLNHPQLSIQSNTSSQPISSQNLFNVLQKRIQQGNLSINSAAQQQNMQLSNNPPPIQILGNGPSRNSSSNKLILPPKPQSGNVHVAAQNLQNQNKSKLPKLFKNSNRTFLKKVNSRNEEIKGLQIQAQKAISNSFV